MKEAPPPKTRLRRLSAEEIALWTEVARGVSRRRGATLPAPAETGAGKPPAKTLLAAPSPSPEPQPVKLRPPPLAPLERRLKRELSRGRGAIDAALDLHGMTQAEAHQALRGFLRHAQARGARLVIVVTGKGGSPGEAASWSEERGVLRRMAPHWLRDPDLWSIVLGFEEAGRAHGGSGALYVRLRRG